MKNSIKIVSGKLGWYLMVNGMYIHMGFKGEIKAIEGGNSCFQPDGSTQWVSVPKLREFWKTYMYHIIAATQHPYKSVWGNLVREN